MSIDNDGTPGRLPAIFFGMGVRLLPLVSIDLVLRTPAREMLVGLRRNEPARGFYFVPGGAIWKNETLDHAFARILKDETGLVARRQEARFAGVYEHFWPSNFLSNELEFGTHYVVLAHVLLIQDKGAIKLSDDQHERSVWMTEDEMRQNEQVHARTRDYCDLP